jgi:hypothetical protein
LDDGSRPLQDSCCDNPDPCRQKNIRSMAIIDSRESGKILVPNTPAAIP